MRLSSYNYEIGLTMNQIHSERIQLELELFNSKPDAALLDIEIVSILLSRSIPSLYRDIDSGYLEHPIKVGRLNRWSVGTIKKILANGYKK